MAGVFDLVATGGGGPLFNEEEVRRAAPVLFDPTFAVEFRSRPSDDYRIVPAGDIDAVCKAIGSLPAGSGIYYTLNPIKIGQRTRTRRENPIGYRWLFLDIDRAKTEDNKDLSATEEERERARSLAHEIQEHLTAMGWPAPVLIDSGNGWHLLYRIDLPNNSHTHALLRTFVKAVADAFHAPDRGDVDLAVHNPSRIARMPGTWARKGENTPERPHRQCRLVYVPNEPVVVTPELIRHTTEILRSSEDDQPRRPVEPDPVTLPPTLRNWLVVATSKSGGSYGKAALERELARVAGAPSGQRNTILNKAAFCLGQLVAGGVLQKHAVESALTHAANQCGLDRDPQCGPRGIEATIRSGLEAGFQSPRGVPTPAGRPPMGNGKAASKERPTGIPPARLLHAYEEPTPALDESDPLTVRASAITPRKVEWLWPGRIPLGKLTTFAGPGGLGKTFVLLDLTSRITRGLEWPSAGGECAEVGQVLFVSGEDDPDDTLVPRLIELGADLEKVSFLTTKAQDRFQLADLAMLTRAVEEIGPGCRFVAIDPPTAYLGGVDDHKNADLRGLLGPLKSWAQEHRIAVVFNTHVNKGGGQKVDAAARVMGSVAWVNAVRAAHMFAADPEDPEIRLFCPMKNNLGPSKKGLSYRITVSNDLAKVEWLGEVETTANEAVNQQTKSRKVVASEWLIERFAEKRHWPSDELFTAARACGVSRDAIFQAKNQLDLPKARKTVLSNGSTVWEWWVPDDWPHLPAPPAAGQDAVDI